MAEDIRIANRRNASTKPAAPAPTKVRGRPIATPVGRPFKNTRDFQEQLIALRADKSKTQRMRNAEEAKLIARRRQQLGG